MIQTSLQKIENGMMGESLKNLRTKSLNHSVRNQ